jgi:hypothetical protein
MALDHTLAVIGGTTPGAMARRGLLFLGPDDFLRFERVNGLARRRAPAAGLRADPANC